MIRSHHFSAILPLSDAIAHSSTDELLVLLKGCVQAAGLTAVAEATATFSPQGVSAVLLLEESHVALHLWSEYRQATVDIHVCDYHQDNRFKAETLAEQLAIALSGSVDRVHWHTLDVVG